MDRTKKIIGIIQIYRKYLHQFLIEIYFHYTSPLPFRLFLKKLSLAHRAIRIFLAPPSPGRKPLDQETLELILEMKKLNPSWGGKRISQELEKIGYSASKDTVLKYLEIYGLHDPPPLKNLTWSQFLNNHKFKVSIDFTSIISFMGRQMFVFVMINHHTRELLSLQVTYHPHLDWLKQIFRNLSWEVDEYPSLCLCDRDQSFGKSFEKMLWDYFRIKLKRIPYSYPEKNGRVERFHRSLKLEAFENLIPINLSQAQRICNQYKKYYNENRPHQALSGKIPQGPLKKQKHRLKFVKKKHLDGKITSFNPRKAA